MYKIVSNKISIPIVMATVLGGNGTVLADMCDNMQSYIGGDLSYSKYRYARDFSSSSAPRTKVPGLGIIGGMRYYQNFGSEVGYTLLRQANQNIPNSSDKLKGRNMYLDFLGYLPVAEKIELLGSVGLGHMRAPGKLSKTGARMGAGAQYNIDNNWSLRALMRYQKIGGKSKDSNTGLLRNMSSVNLSVSYLL